VDPVPGAAGVNDPSHSSLVEARRRMGFANPLLMTSRQASLSVHLAHAIDVERREAENERNRQWEAQESARRAARTKCAYSNTYDGHGHPPCSDAEGHDGCATCDERHQAVVSEAYRTSMGCTD